MASTKNSKGYQLLRAMGYTDKGDFSFKTYESSDSDYDGFIRPKR